MLKEIQILPQPISPSLYQSLAGLCHWDLALNVCTPKFFKTWSELEVLAKTLAHPLGINSVNTLHDGYYRQRGMRFIIMVLNL